MLCFCFYIWSIHFTVYLYYEVSALLWKEAYLLNDQFAKLLRGFFLFLLF